MNRRWVALVLALVFAGPLAAPLASSGRTGCARCVKTERCCCSVKQGAGGCALSRPCASGSDTDGVLAQPGVEKALPVVSNTPAVPPARPQVLSADLLVDPAGSSPVPPDPPPRASL